MPKIPRVFVGMSGGVDSSVAALRLKRRGFDVVGVFIKVWHPDWLTCNWEEERLDAMRVAAHLDIPFLTCDAEETYKRDVADYFIREYSAGRTPNPDVMCNKYVKFGTFLTFAKEHGADYVATGHYARRIDTTDGPELHRAIDFAKDQSYFLWSLTAEQLRYTLFPIGDTIKDRVRAEAAAHGIPTAQKKDSQGICFLGHIDIREFLSHYVNLVAGPIITETGAVIGIHQGALIYTLGQRHGLTINTKEEYRPTYYVTQKDVVRNTLVVSTTKPVQNIATAISLTTTTLRRAVHVGDILAAQSRYHQAPFRVQVSKQIGDRLELSLLESADLTVAGQSCVLYTDTECVGGGIIL